MGEGRYRELQALQKLASDERRAGRLRLAAKLLSTAIERAYGPGRVDATYLASLRRQLHRDYGELLEILEDLPGALAHLQRAGEDRAVLRCLLALGRDVEAGELLESVLQQASAAPSRAWLIPGAVMPALFLLGDHDRLLEVARTIGPGKDTPGSTDRKRLELVAGAFVARGLMGSSDPLHQSQIKHELLRCFESEAEITATGRRLLAVPRKEFIARFMGLARPRVTREEPDFESDFSRLLSVAVGAACTRQNVMSKIERVCATLRALLDNSDWSGAVDVLDREVAAADAHSQGDLLEWSQFEASCLTELRFDVALLSGPTSGVIEWARGRRARMHWRLQDKCVNLVRHLGNDISAVDVLWFWGDRVEPSEVLMRFPAERDALLEERLQTMRRDLGGSRVVDHIVARWFSNAMPEWKEFIFRFMPGGADWARRTIQHSWLSERLDFFYPFSQWTHDSGFLDFGKALVADLDRELRVRLGLPPKGEGWLHQTLMLRELRAAFAPIEVVAEGSPAWLRRQRFDAWIPSLRLAVEYQGEQHFQPVPYFGGEQGFSATRERDAAKADRAAANRVVIEYIAFDENLGARVCEIVSKHHPARANST